MFYVVILNDCLYIIYDQNKHWISMFYSFVDYMTSTQLIFINKNTATRTFSALPIWFYGFQSTLKTHFSLSHHKNMSLLFWCVTIIYHVCFMCSPNLCVQLALIILLPCKPPSCSTTAHVFTAQWIHWVVLLSPCTLSIHKSSSTGPE